MQRCPDSNIKYTCFSDNLHYYRY